MRSLPCIVLNLCLTLHSIGSINTYSSDSDFTCFIERYFITDALHDLIGCTNRAEEIFIANTLAELVSEFYLRTNLQWIGASKWIVRSLKQYDQKFADHLVEAFDVLYKTGDKNKVVQLVDKVLGPYGGQFFKRLFVG